MELRLNTCTLRRWRPGDEESLVRHANSRNVWINLRDRFPHPYTLEDAREWLRLADGMRPEITFAIAVGGDAVGGIGFTPQEDVYRRSAEVGYWLGEEFWGRGIMTEALRAVTEYAFTATDLCRLYALVFEGNAASARVLEKAGYTFEGRLRRSAFKDGLMLDQLLYATVR